MSQAVSDGLYCYSAVHMSQRNIINTDVKCFRVVYIDYTLITYLMH